jgi:hypothetical protein
MRFFLLIGFLGYICGCGQPLNSKARLADEKSRDVMMRLEREWYLVDLSYTDREHIRVLVSQEIYDGLDRMERSCGK